MKFLYLTFAIFSTACFAVVYSQTPVTEAQFTRQYLQSLKDAGFNKDILPEGNGGHGSPVIIRCSMYIIDLFKVNEDNMDYTAQFYFRQKWNDSRLSYYDKDISQVILNDPEKIWVPDLFFFQEQKGIHHQIVTPNTFIRISPSGEVMFSVRLTMTFSCPMDFSKYPHDVQKCDFSAESYGRTTKDIEIEWAAGDSVGFNKEIRTHDFTLTDVTKGTNRVTVNTSTYSTLVVTLTLNRFLSFYMQKLYVPFILLSMIAFASFWIPPKMVALRLSLLLVVLYLMVSTSTDINNDAPPTPYVKGSDVWIAVCQSLVFVAFLEFIAVYIIARNAEKLRKNLCKDDPEAQSVLGTDAKIKSMTPNSVAHIVASRLKNDELSKRIDKIFGISFPAFFVVFNIVYFLIYRTVK